MRYPAAYYLMLLYITVTLKPVLPVIVDFWNHEFNEIEHVATVHVKYGSHHLQGEVANSNSSETNNKAQNSLKLADIFGFHILTNDWDVDTGSKKIGYSFLHFILPKLAFVALSRQGPPPKFSYKIS